MSKRTALHGWHRSQGARFTDFAGWEMPVQYAGVVPEHLAVRSCAGLFDVSHMGQIFVEGAGAFEFLQKLCTNDVSKCPPGKAIYSHLCNPKGGVIDDIFVYCLRRDRYLVVVNAATISKDFAWMRGHVSSGVELTDASGDYGMVAVQGPAAERALPASLGPAPRRHELTEIFRNGKSVFLCRTGYTGEDGFEIVAPNEIVEATVKEVMETGREAGIVPCGLGARDTLRLEAGYLLYGSDVDDGRTPLEAGLPWVVKFDKGDFIGREALAEQKEKGTEMRLAAFKLSERGVPRHGSAIFRGGLEAGRVTSGTFSPTLEAGIALGYVPGPADGPWSIQCLSRRVPAQAVRLPFYARPKPFSKEN
ncbi:MAG: hypothetical protein A2636_05155 [Elusimicrobia bacterium RIFCSPHIGHO2_01_FULL_64_10]|nr:MAG: hypothetical protein A2636_05155 [Elusimicrobia bacterium RIFCSPHIGHO2_01_FULL_64_10]